MAKQNIRNVYGQLLVERGKRDPRVIVLEADLKDSTQSVQFERAFPDRFVQVGIAEQNMMDVAAGLALAGKIPVTHSFAAFTSMRACEQVRTSLCYPKLNAKLVAAHAGLTAGSAGGSHFAIEDIAIFRAMPNMTVFVPGDARELAQVMDAAFAIHGPVYIRLGSIDYADVYTQEHRFTPGKATLLRQGNDVTIVTTGFLMDMGMQAADILHTKHGVQARVLQMASIKPFDSEAVKSAVKETTGIVTVEDHNIIGGLGSAVCEAACAAGGTHVERIGVQDMFNSLVGTPAYLLNEQGITVDAVIERALRIMAGGVIAP